MTLSTPAKEGIKTGLAVVISVGIAMAAGWDKPYWAALAVVMISLDTTGQSMNKAAMRMLGTLVAGAAVFIFLALFAQQRWSLVLCLSLYYGFCVYMMTGSKRPYFWFVSAFVSTIIMVTAAPVDSLRTFYTVVTRVQENAMGILVYSLITLFLWPRSSGSDLGEASRKLSATQRQLYQSFLGQMVGRGTDEQSGPLRVQEVHLLTMMEQTLSAAEGDTYEVWESRRQWRVFLQLSKNLAEALSRWRGSFPEIQQLSLSKIFPNLEILSEELDNRFSQIDRMLNDKAPTSTPKPVSLVVDHAEVSGLTHFQVAALAVTKSHIDQIENISRSLLDCVKDIKGYAGKEARYAAEENVKRGFAFDPDRFKAAIAVMATEWIAFLIWVFIDPPGHALFAFLSTVIVLLSVMTRMPPIEFALPLALGIVVAGIVYIFVMPHLSGYLDLGLMLFAVTFGAFCLFSEPRQRMTRTGVMAAFLVLITLDNEQIYDFARYANTAIAISLAFMVAFAILTVTTSPRPEKLFLGLLRRFFGHAEFLMSQGALDRDEKNGPAKRWQIALHSNDLLALPAKLAAYGQQIDYRVLPGTKAEQVQALATSLQALAYRIGELVDAREAPQAEFFINALTEEARAWRMAAQEYLRLWRDDPAAAASQGAEMQDRLLVRVSRLEAQIGKTLHGIEEGQLSDTEYENFYRVLGAFRGLSESGIEYARLAGKINWAPWQEARF